MPSDEIDVSSTTVRHAIFYSDACAGQNRNQFIATCFAHAVANIQHLQVIDHKFLETGHTQLECDSMHSAIEFAKKKKNRDICSKSMGNCFEDGSKEVSFHSNTTEVF